LPILISDKWPNDEWKNFNDCASDCTKLWETGKSGVLCLQAVATKNLADAEVISTSIWRQNDYYAAGEIPSRIFKT